MSCGYRQVKRHDCADSRQSMRASTEISPGQVKSIERIAAAGERFHLEPETFVHDAALIVSLEDATPILLAFEIWKTGKSFIKLAGVWLVLSPGKFSQAFNFVGAKQNPESLAATSAADAGITLLRSDLDFIGEMRQGGGF